MESAVFMTPHSDLLNLGCGMKFHRAWVNVDYNKTGQDVLPWDLRKGIPFPNASFRVVYHSHVLEHYNKNDALKFLKECRRVLQGNGILRVVVPDLEAIARTYLDVLENTDSGTPAGAENYTWMLLELYDQTVRNYSGGAMAEYLLQQEISNEEFVIMRCGVEAKKMRDIVCSKQKGISSSDASSSPESMHKFRNVLAFIMRIPSVVREILLKKMLGAEYEALEIGRFRLSGEVHQWMYDRYSLRCLLESCGFVEILQRNAFDSYIPNWSVYGLDTELDGSIYKPDSMYMEAIKL